MFSLKQTAVFLMTRLISDGDKQMDDQDPVAVLYSMYTMTFTPLGRNTLVHVLAQDSNVNCLVPFVKTTGKYVAIGFSYC